MKHFTILFFILFSQSFYSFQLHDMEYHGKVVKIMDGDTFELLLEDHTTLKVRLNGIDAPEKGMDYSKVSKYYLGKLVFNKEVKVIKKSQDRYGRTIGDVYVDDLYINAEMIKTGMAWHYKKYSKNQDLADFETLARKNKIGLWGLQNPIEPWEYRKNQRLKDTTP